MDNLVSILKIPALNHDVKNEILRYIQDWATAFEGKPALSYVGEVYRTLQREGEYYHTSRYILHRTIGGLYDAGRAMRATASTPNELWSLLCGGRERGHECICPTNITQGS